MAFINMNNMIQLEGNLGRDPETSTTPSGRSVTRLSLAVDDSYTAKDGNKVERTIWVRCTAWNGAGETIARYCSKGSRLRVLG